VLAVMHAACCPDSSRASEPDSSEGQCAWVLVQGLAACLPYGVSPDDPVPGLPVVGSVGGRNQAAKCDTSAARTWEPWQSRHALGSCNEVPSQVTAVRPSEHDLNPLMQSSTTPTGRGQRVVRVPGQYAPRRRSPGVASSLAEEAMRGLANGTYSTASEAANRLEIHKSLRSKKQVRASRVERLAPRRPLALPA
jgi:hypothetical protein